MVHFALIQNFCRASNVNYRFCFSGHGNVSFLIPIAGTTNEFLASTQLDIRHLVWNGEQDLTPKSSILYSALQESDGSKFNDAKVDRSGNLWAGKNTIRYIHFSD